MPWYDFLTKRFRKEELPEMPSPKLEEAPEEPTPELEEAPEEPTPELGEFTEEDPFASFEETPVDDPDWPEPEGLGFLVGSKGITINEQVGGGYEIIGQQEDVEAEGSESAANEFGTCKIVSNGGSGNYTITRIKWDGSAYVADTEGSYFEISARDFGERAYGVEGSTPIRFWIQGKTDGTTEIVIDSMPLPDIPNTSNKYVFMFDGSASEPNKLVWSQGQTQSVVTAVQVDGANNELEKKTATITVINNGTESGWSVFHTGTNC